MIHRIACKVSKPWKRNRETAGHTVQPDQKKPNSVTFQCLDGTCTCHNIKVHIIRVILIVIVLIAKQLSIEHMSCSFFSCRSSYHFSYIRIRSSSLETAYSQKIPATEVHCRLCGFSKTPKCSKHSPRRGFNQARISTCRVRRYLLSFSDMHRITWLQSAYH